MPRRNPPGYRNRLNLPPLKQKPPQPGEGGLILIEADVLLPCGCPVRCILAPSTNVEAGGLFPQGQPGASTFVWYTWRESFNCTIHPVWFGN